MPGVLMPGVTHGIGALESLEHVWADLMAGFIMARLNSLYVFLK